MDPNTEARVVGELFKFLTQHVFEPSLVLLLVLDLDEAGNGFYPD